MTEDGRTEDGKWKIGQCSVGPETAKIYFWNMIFEKLVGIESLWKLSILRSFLFPLIQLLGPLSRILLQNQILLH